MSNTFVKAVVEGKTEQSFINEVLAPTLWSRGIYLEPTILKKPGQDGGDVKFTRVNRDIGNHLKQRRDTYVTVFIDFYGISSNWPNLDEAKAKRTPREKAECFTDDLRDRICNSFSDYCPEQRFIPYVAMHEFEAILFSDPKILADAIQIDVSKIEDIIQECLEPENINDSSITAPSKRLNALSSNFKKTTTGINIAKNIGINTIRQKCPLFHQWLSKIEALGDER